MPVRTFVTFVFFCSILALCSCATNKTPSLHYSAPSVAPVSQKIDAADSWIVSAQGNAAKAKAAVATAIAAANKGDIAQVKLSLVEADRFIDALTAELLSARGELAAAKANNANLQKQISIVTDAGNAAVDKANVALAEREKIDAKRRSAVSQRNKLFALLIASVIWIFRAPLLNLAGFVVRKFAGVPW